MEAKVRETQTLRRSERIAKEVAILLVGCDAQGRSFMENTKTVVLSRHGAGMVSKYKLAVDQELVMVRKDSNKETAIRVVGEIGLEGDLHTYGVAFLDPELDFWGIEFAVPSENSISKSGMVLACVLCGCRQPFGSSFEADIYATRGSVLRYCPRCSSTTAWMLSSEEVLDEAPAKPPAGIDTPAEGPFKNRRQHVRAKVKFEALVRAVGRDDIAVCENMSRGGLCFRSRRRYPGNANIEVAAPYSTGSACILVPARIVYVQEVEDSTFRYGVGYLPRTKEVSSRAAAASA